MSDDLNQLICFQVQHTAEWRRQKARQFPDDGRNLAAADELERLAAEIVFLEGSEIHEQIRALVDQYSGLDIDEFSLNEKVYAELRSIGFRTSYSGAGEFLEWYRNVLREELDKALDEALPVADLAEEVKNYPAVKAAKEAYDQAYAKAYAEARKKL
jgi:hypothetical protein